MAGYSAVKACASLLIVASCGRINFDPRSDAGSSLDDVGGEFSPPMIVTELADAGQDDDPTLTADLLEIYFVSARAGGQGGTDIWRSTRTASDGPWQPPQPVMELSSASTDEGPGITADGLEMYFTSNRGGGNDIWTSTRPTRGDVWSTPTLVTELSSGAGDFQAQPSPSKLRLVLYRSSGNRDIYEATRTAVGMPWTSPSVLGGISSAAGDRSPCLYGSDLVIAFSSDRDSSMTDVQDLFVATRPTVADPFDAPQPLTDLSSAQDDDGPWLSPDGRVMFFSSDRSGDDEIYEVRR